MATALTPGYIYLIESDDTDNDDWIADHGGDPDHLDLTDYIEGEEYCKIEMPSNFIKNFITGIKVVDVSGGTSFDTKFEKRAYQTLANGLSTSRANGELVEQFIMAPRHTSGDSSVYKDYYLIFYFGVDDHVQFTDASGNRKSYCKGAVLSGSMIWVESMPGLYTLKLIWRSIW